MQLLHQVLQQTAAQYPDNIAFDAPDHVLTYSQLQARVEALTGALQNLGIQKGDRVAILSPNCADYIVWHYATVSLGAITMVLNTRLVTGEMEYAINNAEACALVIQEQCAEHLPALAESCPSLRFTVSMGDLSGTTYKTEELIDVGHQAGELPQFDPSHPAVLMFTSGTTGRPKGALQTHEGSVLSDTLTAEMLSLTQEDNFLAFMPYFHQAGLVRTRAALTAGTTNVISNKLPPEKIALFMQEKKISVTMLVPPYNGMLMKLCEEEGITIPSLRLIIGGAGPLMKDFCEKNQCRCMAVYGQTEVTGLITAIFDKDSYERPYSLGKAVPDMEVQIWNAENQPVSTGESGEIMARSKRCIPGYWRNEEATKALYTDGWLHTGDLGQLDEDGFLYFMGRKKELIKTGGENVYPIEVEAVLKDFPGITGMIVMGVPDQQWGEAVTAVLVPAEAGKTITADEVKDFCRGKIAGYKIPKKVFCVDEIPYNHTGKPDKLALKKRLADA